MENQIENYASSNQLKRKNLNDTGDVELFKNSRQLPMDDLNKLTRKDAFECKIPKTRSVE